MTPHTAQTVLDTFYLETRAKLLEVAAVLDRIDRASGSGAALSPGGQKKREQIDQAIQVLLRDTPHRAEAIQQLFSRDYDPQWRSGFELPIKHASPSDTRES